MNNAPLPNSISAFGTPQVRQVFEHMQKTGSITGLEAWDHYRVRSLTRRICDIKGILRTFETPYSIISERKTHPVTKQRYVRYHLVRKGR